MEILSAMDLKKGRTAKQTRLYSVSQPLQFLPAEKKTQEWAAWNLDWIEWNGIKQIQTHARRLMKNYKLAEGIIDKSDYISEDVNDLKDMVDALASDDELEALELKFYPIIPNVINTLVSEFAKRDKKISFRAVDEYSYNEIFEKKKAEIENSLVQYAESKMLMNMLQQGLDPNDPEVQQLMKEKLDPQNVKSLPEIADFYDKDYEILAEKWASKQHIIDFDRFKMDELEETAFKDKLVTDREFWHFCMYEDDYEVELWNPVTTFYHKSPETKYISNANYVGNIELMTTPDVIDKHGWRMTEEQLKSLEERYLTDTPGYNIGGYQNDGTFYDAAKSHAWNTNRPSLEYRQLLSGFNYVYGNKDIMSWILSETEGNYYLNNPNLFRVTTMYWKSQRKVGYLTKIDESGKVTTEIITEDYTVTDNPVYNTTLIKNKTAQNLIFGEHIEWIWINQTWGGIKIGPNTPTLYGAENTTGISPIYLGINQNQIKPLRFQFKGDQSLYGCKLPVEGRIFNDRNTKSMSLVDAMKPFQIGFNMANNQIADIMIDEMGSVLLFDQNALPKHSLGEDWGKGNLAKANEAMRTYQMLPVDTSIDNTESPLSFQHYQSIDLSQTARLVSRMQLAQFFKQQAMEQVGLTPQRMGQPIGSTVTATEAEQTQVGSYAQTEMHFIEHCDYLMPRVHQMRTDLAQYYHSTKSSVRLQHITSVDERINFEINGTDLLLRDINVYATTKANHRKILEQLKMVATNNNTLGASVYDLGQVFQADSIGTMNTILKKAEARQQAEMQAARQQEQEMQRMQIEAAEKEKAMEQDFEAQENEKNRRTQLLVAEIRASGYGAMMDINENKQSDFIDNMVTLKQSDQYQETINIQREKLNQNKAKETDKIKLKREEMALKRDLKNKDLEIAKTNKNRYDFGKPPKKDNK